MMSVFPISGSSPLMLTSRATDTAANMEVVGAQAIQGDVSVTTSAGAEDRADSATQNQNTQLVSAPEAIGGILESTTARANSESVIVAQMASETSVSGSAQEAAEAYERQAEIIRADPAPGLVANAAGSTDPFEDNALDVAA